MEITSSQFWYEIFYWTFFVSGTMSLVRICYDATQHKEISFFLHAMRVLTTAFLLAIWWLHISK